LGGRAETDPGNQASECQPKRVGRQGRCNRREAIEQNAELIDPLAAQAVGELALAYRADE